MTFLSGVPEKIYYFFVFSIFCRMTLFEFDVGTCPRGWCDNFSSTIERLLRYKWHEVRYLRHRHIMTSSWRHNWHQVIITYFWHYSDREMDNFVLWDLWIFFECNFEYAGNVLHCNVFLFIMSCWHIKVQRCFLVKWHRNERRMCLLISNKEFFNSSMMI